MNATILSNSEKHYPVLLKEILSIISPQNGGTFIDCTFGQGGYSKEFLKFNKTKVIAIDRDHESSIIANQIKQQHKDQFSFFNKKFSEIDKIKIENCKIKAVIFDLGYSYTQIKDPQKGLSFETDGKLNMQLGLNSYSDPEYPQAMIGKRSLRLNLNRTTSTGIVERAMLYYSSRSGDLVRSRGGEWQDGPALGRRSIEGVKSFVSGGLVDGTIKVSAVLPWEKPTHREIEAPKPEDEYAPGTTVYYRWEITRKNTITNKIFLPIFKTFVEKVVKKKDARPFKIPKNINLVLVDAETGMKADINTKKVIYESFKKKDNFMVILEKSSNKDKLEFYDSSKHRKILRFY